MRRGHPEKGGFVRKSVARMATAFPSNLLERVIVQHCLRHAFCLVTQDRGLAANVLRLGQRESVEPCKADRRGSGCEGWRFGQMGAFLDR